MEFSIGVIGIILGVIGITLFVLCRIEFISIINQLNRINHHKTNQRVIIKGNSKISKELGRKINETLNEKHHSQEEHIRMEKELREMIANLSHDLRTPLTSISGYLQLLEKEDIDEEKKKKYIQIISGRVQNLKGLIENFYELSKVDSEQYEIEYEEVHIGRILCELIAEFYQEFVDKDLDLQIKMDEQLPSIYGNGTAITRILLNLIQNTLRYAKKNVEIKVTKQDQEVKLSISNEAGALKEEDVPYLFDRFFMANRVRNGEGTGVGLAVVKKLVTLLNGRVEARLENEQIIISIYFKICI